MTPFKGPPPAPPKFKGPPPPPIPVAVVETIPGTEECRLCKATVNPDLIREKPHLHCDLWRMMKTVGPCPYAPSHHFRRR